MLNFAYLFGKMQTLIYLDLMHDRSNVKTRNLWRCGYLLSNSCKIRCNSAKDEKTYQLTFLLVFSGSSVTKSQVYLHTKMDDTAKGGLTQF